MALFWPKYSQEVLRSDPDGLKPDERERVTALLAGLQPTAAAAQGKGTKDEQEAGQDPLFIPAQSHEMMLLTGGQATT